ncbi:phosphoribosyltransferase family protein [Protofrankia sp. BMG5.30]|uniref:phosphoribosyltransferase family protein n=1 Tax=Protofrankia sp. BMG5.30 TaxID=1834514 RepID=UPI00097607AA|nr:phosphoribosyltransferase family protein [Protofrankia sp. BMG5.30]ONH36366.1 phosphoribosyl transferase [Protofrankia sp. BMG5.30]
MSLADAAAVPSNGAGWLWDELGLDVRLRTDVVGGGLDAMVGLALRRNPRRAHLLVSRVLGKHLPVRPARSVAAGHLLAAQVRADQRATGGDRVTVAPLVLGYCETATSLGHTVADGLDDCDYLHTTRRLVPGATTLLDFDEAHSHATFHWLMPGDPELVRAPRPLVLVDDELSTGRTALGTIRALHAFAPRPSYTVATLFDARPAPARRAFDELADRLGVPVRVVSLLAGEVTVPDDVTARAERIRARYGSSPTQSPTAPAPVRFVTPDWPEELPDGARHGWSRSDRALLAEVAPLVAKDVAAALNRPSGRVLVLGTEELMYTPLRIGDALDQIIPGEVVYHSTTRSPVHPIDADGYAIRCARTFPAPDDPGRVSQVYNVRPGLYDDIVVVVDSAANGRAAVGAAGVSVAGAADVSGMVGALRRCAPVTVVTIPARGPAGRPLTLPADSTGGAR